MGILYPSSARQAVQRANLVRYSKNSVTQPLNPPNLPLLLAATGGEC